MPFPPIFDRIWDETFPPDTQPANQLGADIRNTKADIRERMSLISGTFANRPNPEAIFGGAGFGLLYFATDIGRIYQWDGGAWNEVTNNIISSPATKAVNTVPVVTNAINTDGLTVTIPLNSLVVGSVIRITGSVSSATDFNVNTYAVFFGASQLFLTGPTGVVGNVKLSNFDLSLIVSAAAAQVGSGYNFPAAAVPGSSGAVISGDLFVGTEPINANIIVKTRQVASDAGNVTHNYLAVTWR